MNDFKIFCEYCDAARLPQNMAAHQEKCIVKLDVCLKCGMVQKGFVDSVVLSASGGTRIWTRKEKRDAHAATHRDVLDARPIEIDADFVSAVEDILTIMQPSY